MFVIYIGHRMVSDSTKSTLDKSRLGRKISAVFEEGDSNISVGKARNFINKHGIRLFGIVSPLFPGVLLATMTVYLFGLDRQMFARWMFAGVVFVSGGYVFGYWYLFVR
jgi:hypothetical protein